MIESSQKRFPKRFKARNPWNQKSRQYKAPYHKKYKQAIQDKMTYQERQRVKKLAFDPEYCEKYKNKKIESQYESHNESWDDTHKFGKCIKRIEAKEKNMELLMKYGKIRLEQNIYCFKYSLFVLKKFFPKRLINNITNLLINHNYNYVKFDYLRNTLYDFNKF
jgi:hypothetical protein